MLAGIGQQVDQDLLHAARVRRERERLFGFRLIIHLHARLEPVLGTRHRSPRDIVHLSLGVRNPVVAGINGGGIEDIVQQHRQHLGIVDDVFREFCLFRFREGSVREREQLRKAHDGVERGAHFVAHVLHETRLGGIRLLHPVIGLFQLPDPHHVRLAFAAQDADVHQGECQRADQHDHQHHGHQARG